MGSLSIWHWLVVIAVIAVLFGGRGKISDLMGDVAKGVKSFKKTRPPSRSRARLRKRRPRLADPAPASAGDRPAAPAAGGQ